MIPRFRLVRLAACLGLALAALWAPAARSQGAKPDGALLANAYCQLCHALPDPALLDRATWRDELFPKMRIFSGILPPPTNGVFKDLQILLQNQYFPKAPLIPAEVFDTISNHYVNAAPVTTAAPAPGRRISAPCRQFQPMFPAHRRPPASTSMVQIDAANQVLLLGDAHQQTLDFLNPAGGLLQSLNVGNIPTVVQETAQGLYIGCIGHFFPRDELRGQLIFLEKTDAGLVRREIGGLLPRLSHLQVADVNGDGREDIVVCLFGNLLGRLSWFENRGDGRYAEHVLLDKPGALRCEIRDLNGDGHPDIAVLVAQALESFFVFTGDGRGGFEKHLVYQKPPSWGHTGFQLADFNGDGRPDLLVTNGDNADFRTSPERPHHGIRILLNEGGLKFREAYRFPFSGAFKAVARDFDGDGDLDIAAISFFPNFEHAPAEGFVYLENVGGRGEFRFDASTLPEAASGRWLTLDAGDLDGDGADDVVLGSLIEMPTPVPEALKKRWEDSGPSALILKNTRAVKPASKP